MSETPSGQAQRAFGLFIRFQHHYEHGSFPAAYVEMVLFNWRLGTFRLQLRGVGFRIRARGIKTASAF
jgi:hypothetical protein